MKKKKRGIIQDKKILEKATKFFEKYKVDVIKGVRLLPYIDYVVKNGGFYDMAKMTVEELIILDGLIADGYILDIDGRILITHEFYDFIQEVLWDAYAEKYINK